MLPAGAHGLDGKENGLEADPHEIFGGAVDGENGVHGFEEGGSSRLVETTIQTGGPVSGACNKTLQRVFSAHGFQPFPHPCASGGEANGFSLDKPAAHVIVIYDSHIKAVIADFDSIEH